MTRLVLALVAGLLLCVPVIGHDIQHINDPGAWIGNNKLTDPKSGEWCCDEKDCFAERVDEFSDFVLVKTGEMIPHSRIIWRSADGRWWRCRMYRDGQQTTRCLIGPPKGL